MTNKEIVTQVNEAFTRGDMEGFLAYCTDEVVWHMMGDYRAEGKQTILDWMRSHDGPECLPLFTVENFLAEGDVVVCDGEMTMAVEGNPNWKGRYCDVYNFENGKIKQLRSYIIEEKSGS